MKLNSGTKENEALKQAHEAKLKFVSNLLWFEIVKAYNECKEDSAQPLSFLKERERKKTYEERAKKLARKILEEE
jgi:hypothetical protein